MNSTIQCLSATYPFTIYFLDGSYTRSINVTNPLGMKGNLARAFAELLRALWKEEYTFLSPVTFRKQIVGFANQFSGTDQHDSQEFLSFVLDGLHEDLNRVKNKPPPVEMTPEREAALETLPPEVASEKEWQIYRMRNDSFIVDLFQGQYRNRLECLTCHKVCLRIPEAKLDANTDHRPRRRTTLSCISPSPSHRDAVKWSYRNSSMSLSSPSCLMEKTLGIVQDARWLVERPKP